ncbi:cyclic nucleotide-binding domain-containing protein [Alphaproteobacteria bacterium HT1-32]|nr:cyclic nucleotide-binding domain-containing protein [Alphaproteobacteria bacterium HT1-32]|tara:strand:- start:16 stop:399 length:384 start_codon:yes stop_codon:yes gene_type:complete
MSKNVNQKIYFAGNTIFNEGETGTRAFLIKEGEVEIRKQLGNREILLGTIQKGSIFGEMALIDDQPRSASAVAVRDTTVIIISRDVLQGKLASADPFVRGLLNIFVRNLRTMTKRMSALERQLNGAE